MQDLLASLFGYLINAGGFYGRQLLLIWSERTASSLVGSTQRLSAFAVQFATHGTASK
jgi:hypothetical protein